MAPPKSLIEVFEEGLDARDEAGPLKPNPHDPGSKEHEAWKDGSRSDYAPTETSKEREKAREERAADLRAGRRSPRRRRREAP